MKKNYLSNNTGVSLLELVVTIAIIAILTAVAVPQYRSYEARALQKDGFALLGVYYVAAQAAKAEYGVYPGNLVQMTGFRPSGRLYYRLHTQDGTDVGIGINDNACQTTASPCDCGGTCPNAKTWSEHPIGAIGTRLGPHPISGGFCPDGFGNGCVARFTNDNNFVVKISAVINLNSTTIDCYDMNDQKIILMCQDGLN